MTVVFNSCKKKKKLNPVILISGSFLWHGGFRKIKIKINCLIKTWFSNEWKMIFDFLTGCFHSDCGPWAESKFVCFRIHTQTHRVTKSPVRWMFQYCQISPEILSFGPTSCVLSMLTFKKIFIFFFVLCAFFSFSWRFFLTDHLFSFVSSTLICF